MPAQPNLFTKQYLLTAGPTPLPPAVSQVMAEPILYHRAPAFIEVYERVLGRLPEVFQTRNQVLCYAASGTGALESAVANLVRPGQGAVVASCGKFGERWAELCEAYEADMTHLAFEWGEKVDPARLDAALGELASPPRAVFTTFSETSTGVVNDIEAIAEVVSRHGSILCVDAVSGLGAAELKQDEWGVDVVISGSQKALMCPPGLAFASVSERALALAAENGAGRYYFDWGKTAKGQAQSPANSAFTPAVSLFMALDVALAQIMDEGLDEVFARHALLARAARAGIEAAGLERFGPEDDAANVVTAARLPDEIDGAAVPKLMRDRYGVTIAGGQGHLKGKIARIAHCGYFGGFDIIVALSALELALADVGHQVEPGAAAGAAMRVFAEAGVTPAPVG
ncbi:alanine--glyoxylate aminotransferase family protein [Thermoleophilia bacterium SCSIO 60948]|nr:alanine--glyoxylate aminotransferase family protein [Thermoleophilia bacterium SCSIO 60948]